MSLDPSERFAVVVAARDAMALDEACLLVAAHAQPRLDVAAEQARFDGLAEGLAGATPAAVVEHLCGPLGFAGATEDYYEPRSSLLPEVLDTRRGVPIALGVVAMEVGRRVEAPLVGVGMPGHFLVADGTRQDRYFDLFHGGSLLDSSGCRALFERLHPGVPWSAEHLSPVGPTAIVVRTLGNLANAYRRAGDRAGLAWVLGLRLLLPDPASRDRRELAVLLGAMGRFDQAAVVLEASGDDRDEESAARLRARLN